MQLTTTSVSVQLPKPLGLLLEERAGAAGAEVASLIEGGSALSSNLVFEGDVVVSIDGKDVSSTGFDEIMEMLGDAGEIVDLVLERQVTDTAESAAGAAETVTKSAQVDEEETPEPMPATATIAIEGGQAIEVPTGQLLRKVLQDNKQELYSLMGKMTNCGGVGQCGTCAVDIDAKERALSPRTAAEDRKLKGKPSSRRLACQVVVQGDMFVKLQPK